MARFKPTKSLAKKPKKFSSPKNVDKSNDEKPANEEETHLNEDKSNQEKKLLELAQEEKTMQNLQSKMSGKLLLQQVMT
jgi:hypothetical protein